MKRLQTTKVRLFGGRELGPRPRWTFTSWGIVMTKSALKTACNPLRVLNNEDIHEMIGTPSIFFPEPPQKLMRSFIETTHVSHHERNEIAGNNIVTMRILKRKLTAFLVHRVLHELLQRSHLFLH